LNSWLTVWLNGCLTRWLNSWLTDYLAGWLTTLVAKWLTDWLAECLIDWLASWMVDWLTGWLSGRLAEWLIDWLPGLLTDWLRGLRQVFSTSSGKCGQSNKSIRNRLWSWYRIIKSLHHAPNLALHTHNHSTWWQTKLHSALRLLPGLGATPCRNPIELPGNNIDRSTIIISLLHGDTCSQAPTWDALSERRI